MKKHALTSISLMSLIWAMSATLSLAQTKKPDDKAAASGDAVTVTGQRRDATNGLDRKIYRSGHELSASQGTASDVLSRLPSVNVDPDGNVSLRGSGQVTVLIDGKPSAQTSGASGGDGLTQIPSEDIDRVEVITTPGAEFSANGTGGIINIITKHNRSSGTAQLSLGDKTRFNSALSLAKNTPHWNLSTGISVRQDDRIRHIHADRDVTDAITAVQTLSQHELREHIRRLSTSGRAELSFRPDAAQTFSLSLNHAERAGSRAFNQYDTAASSVAAPTLATRHSDGVESRVDGNQGLSYVRKIADGESLKFGMMRSLVHEREHYAYTNSYSPANAAKPPQDRLNLSLDLITTLSNLDYSKALNDTTGFKTGLSLQLDANRYDNSGDFVDPTSHFTKLDPNITNHFRYNQAIWSAYASLNGHLGKWAAQAGLRGEQTRVHIHQITGNLETFHNYWALYPSLHLTRAIGENQHVRLNMARRVNRPDPEALNPFTDNQDTHNLRAGNANLKPEDTRLIEAGFDYDKGSRSYGLTAYVRDIHNSVTDITRALSADVFLNTKTNLPQLKARGIEFSWRDKLTPQLTLSLSGNGFDDQIDAKALGFTGFRSTRGLNAKTSLDFKLSAADTAQVSFSHNDRRLTPQGQGLAVNLTHLGYRHQFNKDLALVATASDIFNGQRFIRQTSGLGFHETVLRQNMGRYLFIGLTYSFGLTKKEKPAFEYDKGGN